MKSSFIKIVFHEYQPFHCEYIDLNSFDHPWHFHPEFELTLILESEGTRYVGDHTERFKSGDLVLLGPNLPHLWQNDKTHMKNLQKRSRAVVLQFSKELMHNALHKYVELKPLYKLIHLSERGISFSEGTSRQASLILKEIPHKNGLRKWTAIFNLFCLLAEDEDCKTLASLGYQPKLRTVDSDIMNSVFDYVRNNLHLKITLQEMADRVHLSKPSFCRYFKQKTSKSFFTFLNEYRIGHAKKLLQENPRHTVNTIAFQSGFPSVQHFNTKFKQLNGITPTSFRQRFVQKIE